MVTYNHEPFIAQAIESVLMQETDFEYEIIIGEDCSTDATKEIVKKYAAKHPKQIRALLRERNLGGFGRHNFIRTLEECAGEHIALLEGDDHWTSPYKLQKQVDFLDANPDFAGCFHNGMLIDGHGNVLKDRILDLENRTFVQRDMFALYAREPSCSVLFRSSVVGRLPKWYLKQNSDFFLDLLITDHGKYFYMDENMCAHVKHSGGWSAQDQVLKHEEQLERFLILYNERKFRKKYTTEIKTHISYRTYHLAQAYWGRHYAKFCKYLFLFLISYNKQSKRLYKNLLSQSRRRVAGLLKRMLRRIL